MLNQTLYAHIVTDEADVPYLVGTNTKVIELVLDRIAYGWSAEELHLQHSHLTLGQIHSALAYYWDHQDEIDDDIQRRLEYVEDVRTNSEPTNLISKLKAQGLLP
ncbi:MAG: DUF433 domain-containing protein [Thermoanaerobaculia bacterium]